MKQIFFKMTLLSLLIFGVIGCDESIYGSIANKDTSEAVTDSIDFAYIKGNCAKVVSYYDGIKAKGGTLSTREATIYSNALLACSGFDLVSGIDSILGSGAGDDIYGSISSIMGTTNINQGNLNELKEQYDKVIENCNSMKPLPQSMITVCGLAATSDTILDFADIVLGMPGNEGLDIELTEQGIQSAIDNGSLSDPDGVGTAVDNFLNGPGDSLGDLNTNVGYIDGLGDAFGSDITGAIDGLKDPATNQVTADSLKEFINGFGKK